MLSFCIAYVKKSKIISVKKLPLVGIELGTLGLRELLYCTLIPSWLSQRDIACKTEIFKIFTLSCSIDSS